MTKSNFPKSVRRHIRIEKEWIRRAISAEAERRAALEALYRKLKLPYPKRSGAS